MAYVRRDVTDGVTVMNKDLYDNLQDGIDESKEDLENVKDSVSEVKDQVDTATDIAKGRNRAKVFSTTEKMQEWLSNPENKNLCNVGDNLYIVDVGVPDWWVAEVLNEIDQETGYYYKIAQLETQKVDLTTIEEEIEHINESLTNENNESFNFGYLNGVRGFFTNPSRADDSFIPFKNIIKEQQVVSVGALPAEMGFKGTKTVSFNFPNEIVGIELAYLCYYVGSPVDDSAIRIDSINGNEITISYASLSKFGWDPMTKLVVNAVGH